MSKRWGLILATVILMMASTVAVCSADELPTPVINLASGGSDAAPDAVYCIENDTIYLAGDVNDDEKINSGDAVYVINYLFRGGPAPEPWLAGDANADNHINSGDAIFVISYIFRFGPAPKCHRYAP